MPFVLLIFSCKNLMCHPFIDFKQVQLDDFDASQSKFLIGPNTFTLYCTVLSYIQQPLIMN